MELDTISKQLRPWLPWDHCLAQALWSEVCRVVWGPGQDPTLIALWQELQAEFSLIQLRI